MAEIYNLRGAVTRCCRQKSQSTTRSGACPGRLFTVRALSQLSCRFPIARSKSTLRDAGGTHLINVNFDGKTQSVITREVQRDVLRGTIIHVDFLAVDASTRITAEVQIHLVGESRQSIPVSVNCSSRCKRLSIEAVPADLIDVVEVDISGLNAVGDAIHVRDLKINPNIIVNNDPDELVVRINPLREVTEESIAAEGGTAVEPEVISKGKDDEEDEE